MREFKAIRAVKRDNRRIQRDPNGCRLFKRVRSLRDDPCKVSVHFDILSEAASLLVDATTKGSRDLIANLNWDAEIGPGLYDDPRKIASKDRSRTGATPGVYSCGG